MNVVYSSLPRKQIHKLPLSEFKKIDRKLKLLISEPFLGKPLTGELHGIYSLKAWPYRIVYQIFTEDKTIVILQVEYRQGVYK